MKKLLTLLLAIAASMGTMFASDTQVDGIWYNFDSNTKTATVTYRGTSYYSYSTRYTGEVFIPNSVTYNDEEYSVTSIGDKAFYGCIGLTSVEIPNSVTSIGESAFFNCYNLTSVTIPNSVITISGRAFQGSSALDFIILPESVGNVGEWAFYDTGIKYPLHNSKLFAYLPNNYSGEYIIPYGIERIAETSLSYCPELTSVIIPNTVRQIGWAAFRNCPKLSSINLPSSLETLGLWAFYECGSLSLITCESSSVPDRDDDLTGSPDVIFYNIGDNATLYVPSESVETYSSSRYWQDFPNIIPLPETTVIASGTFGLEGDNLKWELSSDSILTISGVGEMANSSYPWQSYKTNIKSIVIKPYVTNIGNNAFSSCDNLYQVKIPTTVTTIGYGAFGRCSKLNNVVFPNSIVNCAHYVFEDCDDLTTPIYNSHVFAYMPSSYSGSYTIPDGIEVVAGGSFAGCNNLTSITFPNSTISINAQAFYNCSDLQSIVFGENIEIIEHGAFYGCIKLKEIHLPNKLKVLSNGNDSGGYAGAFENCPLLTSVVIPDSVYSLGPFAFARCTNLKSVSIGKSVVAIKRQAFSGCINLTTFTIPNTITTIGFWAFQNCTGLASVTIGNSVTSIDFQAFDGCTSLNSITNYATIPPVLGSDVFNNVDKSSCTLYVPLESASAYQSAEGWRDFQIGGAAMTAKADPDDASTFYTTFYHGSQKYKLPAGMEAYTATINGDVLVLTKAAEGGDVIPAGTAFILKSNAANLTMDVTDDTPVSVGENILQGVDAATPAPANCYVLSGKSSDNSVKGIGFYRFSGTLGAHKAYLVLAPKAGAPRRLRFAFSETNTTTNVEQIPSIQVPSTKMIENGQLYIMHEGQMYDVRGNKVQ